MKPRLLILAPTREPPPPDTSYEAKERQRIMARDWAAVHISADRRSPFATVLGRGR